MLRLNLFGRFRAEDSLGKEISIKSRKSRALLAYLALSPGKPRSREQLATLLWSDRDDDQARSSLRQALSGLRRDLGDSLAEALRIADDAVSLDPEHVIVESRSPGDELLEGLHINDPAFEEWLRDERLRLEDTVVTEDLPTRLELPDEPSIAVLPFVNMSGDQDQQYFADGITEDIITALSDISSLFVIARHSTEIYKGKAVDVRDVGREQGVRYVLEGSVRKASKRIRVTAQMIDAVTAKHLWAERYDRELNDVFEVQDDITKNIATELNVKLVRGDEVRSLARGTESVDAWERVVRAWPLTDHHVKESCVEARRLANEALALDPNYSSAWVILGWTYYTDALWGWGESFQTSADLAIDCAKRAIECDPENSHGYSLLGCLYVMAGDISSGLEVSRKALALAPNNASNVAIVGMSIAFGGKPRESLPLMQRAVRLSPIYPQWYKLIIGVVHHALGDQEKAIDIFRECAANEPETPLHKLWLVSALNEAGHSEEAKVLAAVVREMEPDFSIRDWIRSFTKDSDLTAILTKNLSEAGLSD